MSGTTPAYLLWLYTVTGYIPSTLTCSCLTYSNYNYKNPQCFLNPLSHAANCWVVLEKGREQNHKLCNKSSVLGVTDRHLKGAMLKCSCRHASGCSRAASRVFSVRSDRAAALRGRVPGEGELVSWRMYLLVHKRPLWKRFQEASSLCALLPIS